MMRKTWSIAVVCGLAGLFGLGAVSLRAQQEPPKAEGEMSPRKAMREKLIALRTEVEMLQLECDATKGALLELLKEFTKADMVRVYPSGRTTLNKEELDTSVEQKKKDFATKLKSLNGKKLDLEDLEKRYNQIR
jgi:hypothetical protein